jgi:hypothetical protein
MSDFHRHVSKSLSNIDFVNFTADDFAGAGNLLKSSQANAKLLEAERARAHRRVLFHMGRVDETERQLGVETRWTPEDPRYIAALSFINNRTFIGVVEHLEGLVVQRLFELSKANLASTGESDILTFCDIGLRLCRLQVAQAHI